MGERGSSFTTVIDDGLGVADMWHIRMGDEASTQRVHELFGCTVVEVAEI